jgi:hypothetical protein
VHALPNPPRTLRHWCQDRGGAVIGIRTVVCRVADVADGGVYVLPKGEGGAARRATSRTARSIARRPVPPRPPAAPRPTVRKKHLSATQHFPVSASQIHESGRTAHALSTRARLPLQTGCACPRRDGGPIAQTASRLVDGTSGPEGSYRRKIGSIKDTLREQVVFDASGRRKGRYDKKQNATFDTSGRRVGTGNLLSSLIVAP